MKGIVLVAVATVAAIAVGLAAKAEHVTGGGQVPAGVSTPVGSSPDGETDRGRQPSPGPAGQNRDVPDSGRDGADAGPAAGGTTATPPVTTGTGHDEDHEDDD